MNVEGGSVEKKREIETGEEEGEGEGGEGGEAQGMAHQGREGTYLCFMHACAYVETVTMWRAWVPVTRVVIDGGAQWLDMTGSKEGSNEGKRGE